jgi:hypothetical protein
MLPAAFGHDPEVPVEAAVAAPVLADPAVNGLESYGEQAMVLEVPDDRFRASLELQELKYEDPALGRVVGLPSLLATPCRGIGMGYKGGKIACGTEIPPQFPGEDAGGPPQLPSNGR